MRLKPLFCFFCETLVLLYATAQQPAEQNNNTQCVTRRTATHSAHAVGMQLTLPARDSAVSNSSKQEHCKVLVTRLQHAAIQQHT
jgi:hypothetical protein